MLYILHLKPHAASPLGLQSCALHPPVAPVALTKEWLMLTKVAAVHGSEY
jgi:hypothetical protein